MTGTHLKGPSSVDNELTTARELNKTKQKNQKMWLLQAPFTRTLHFK